MSIPNIRALTFSTKYLLSNLTQNLSTYKTVKPLKKNLILSPKITTFVHKRNSANDSKNIYNRHCYDEKVEKLINNQINVELAAGYVYLNMASYYGRSNVALPGCYGFFMKMHYEEQEHAISFIKYQNMRGGLVRLSEIATNEMDEWPDVNACLECALSMEKSVKEKLLNIHRAAEEVGDTNVTNMLDTFVQQQEQSIYEISRLITRAKQLTKNEIGKYFFDRELHETHVKSNSAKCTIEQGNKLYT